MTRPCQIHRRYHALSGLRRSINTSQMFYLMRLLRVNRFRMCDEAARWFDTMLMRRRYKYSLYSDLHELKSSNPSFAVYPWIYF